MTWTYRPIKSYVDEEWYAEEVRTMTVHEKSDEPIDTGLLDSSGVPLYRIRQKGPMGYL